jgi:hypothetical protein
MNVPRRFGPTHTTSALAADGILGAWTVAATHGGVPDASAQVVLTHDHLIFTPWDTDETRAWLASGLTAGRMPFVGRLDRQIAASKLVEPVAISLREIEAAEPLNGASWFKPPTVRFTLRDGGNFELGILADRELGKDPKSDQTVMQDFMSHLQSLHVGLAEPR